jgi:colicin import membrane protein
MTKFLLVFAMFFAALAATAQEEDARVKAERARIAAERKQAEDAYAAQETTCYARFAVTDCLKAAKAQRRVLLADLRRQEISLNDAQRKRQAAEHLRELEERASPQSQQEAADKRAKALADQHQREAGAAEKASERARTAASAPGNAGAREAQEQHKRVEAGSARTRKDQEAAENVKRYEQRQQEAKEHKEDLAKRAAERNKPPASSLAVPQ